MTIDLPLTLTMYLLRLSLGSNVTPEIMSGEGSLEDPLLNIIPKGWADVLKIFGNFRSVL